MMKYAELFDTLLDIEFNTVGLQELQDRAIDTLCSNGAKCKQVFDVAYADVGEGSVADYTFKKVNLSDYPVVGYYFTAVARQYVHDMCEYVYNM